jgi:hypothetical protein
MKRPKTTTACTRTFAIVTWKNTVVFKDSGRIAAGTSCAKEERKQDCIRELHFSLGNQMQGKRHVYTQVKTATSGGDFQHKEKYFALAKQSINMQQEENNQSDSI